MVFHAGHVRIYEYNGIDWVQLGADIDGEAAYDRSGAVSLSADGKRVAIGAVSNNGNGYQTGHVRIYEYDENHWIQLGNDIDAIDDKSGVVSLSADGLRVAIGAIGNDDNGYNAGHVRVYEYLDNNWIQMGADIDGEERFDNSGTSVSLSADGTRVAIGAPYNDDNGFHTGQARIYEYNGTSWVQLGADIDGEGVDDRSGSSVSLSADGTRVAIGAPYNEDNGKYTGTVRIYEYILNNWVKIVPDIGGEAINDQSGSAIALSADGKRVAIGAIWNNGGGGNSGQVRIYEDTSQVFLGIQGLALINPISNHPIDTLNRNQSIILEEYRQDQSTNFFNIQALTTNKKIDSVKLQITGPINYTQIEKFSPYALFGDISGNFFRRYLLPGEYTITATPFSSLGGNISIGESYTLTFSVIPSRKQLPEINHIQLINAETNKALYPLTHNQQINLNELTTDLLSIEALTNSYTESVRFELIGPTRHSTIENINPYTLFGDNLKEDFYGGKFIAGEYTLILTPYGDNKARGLKGESLSINFNITSSSYSEKNSNKKSDKDSKKLATIINLSPNPIINQQLYIEFNQSLDSEINYLIYDTKGKLLLSKNEKVKGKWVRILFQDKALSTGTYFLKIFGKSIKPTSLQFIKK